jgi:hypothetical protein
MRNTLVVSGPGRLRKKFSVDKRAFRLTNSDISAVKFLGDIKTNTGTFFGKLFLVFSFPTLFLAPSEAIKTAIPN